jgi:DNA-binding MarR family transcriptional regulator/GNAT superfamily N-acetyltransferase
MDPVAQVRSFNRTVTSRIGVLEVDYLGRHRSLGASRLLFEIGTGGGNIRELRARLGLDSGYASRLLRGLEDEGLIRTGPAPGDARVRFVTLTPAGRRELAVLDRRSDEAAKSLLDGLDEKRRAALTEAMGTVERLLKAGAVRLEVVSPTSAAARECLEHYFEEIAGRFEGGFDQARSLPAEPERMTPPRGYFLMATLDGEPVGCGAMKCYADWGYIKRMWVKQSARGLGIGKRILSELEALARKRGLPVVRLETNRSLVEAQALYLGAGYREVPPFNAEPYAHHWFEKQLQGDSTA